jgi:hypothetical protein
MQRLRITQKHPKHIAELALDLSILILKLVVGVETIVFVDCQNALGNKQKQ